MGKFNIKGPALPFMLVSALFLLWGVANNMNDTLLAAFKRIMSMSDLQTSLVQFAFFGAYFCFALPAAMFIRRYSYKAGMRRIPATAPTGLSVCATLRRRVAESCGPIEMT